MIPPLWVEILAITDACLRERFDLHIRIETICGQCTRLIEALNAGWRPKSGTTSWKKAGREIGLSL